MEEKFHWADDCGSFHICRYNHLWMIKRNHSFHSCLLWFMGSDLNQWFNWLKRHQRFLFLRSLQLFAVKSFNLTQYFSVSQLINATTLIKKEIIFVFHNENIFPLLQDREDFKVLMHIARIFMHGDTLDDIAIFHFLSLFLWRFFFVKYKHSADILSAIV